MDADSKISISVPEMAKRLCISRAGAYNLVKRTDFYPAFRIGNRILGSLSKLDQWIDEQTKGGNA